MSKFDEAVKASLSAANDYQQALQDVEDLVRELDQAIQKATAGIVTVGRHRVGWTVDEDRALAEFHRGSTLGVDPEDHGQAWVILAKAKDEHRSLWEIGHSPDGYPITVTAPDGSEITCGTREDLEQTFIDLLQLLQEKSTKHAS